MSKTMKFNPNNAVVREAITLQLAGGKAANINTISAIGKLIGLCQKKHMSPDDAETYAWALAKARAERDSADMKMRIAVIEPSRTNVSELRGVLRLHDYAYVDDFMAMCMSHAVSLAMLKRLSAWVRKTYAKATKGPDSPAFLNQLRIFRGLKNAGRSGKRSAKRRRKVNPEVALQRALDSVAAFKRACGDDNNFAARALQSLNSLKPYVKRLMKARSGK